MPWKKSEPMEERMEFGESDADAQFSSAVSAIRDQHQDGVQVEGAFSAQRFGRDGRRIAAAEKPFRATARGGSVRNCAPKASALVLGAAQDSGIVFAPARRGGQRKYAQESLGESRPDAAAAAASRSGGGSFKQWTRSCGRQRSMDGRF